MASRVMAQWSLRTKLVALVAVAFVPVVALSALSSYREAGARRDYATEKVVAAAEVAASRPRQILEGSRRILVSACGDDAVRASLDPSGAADAERCQSSLSRLVKEFPAQYSAIVVTDAAGNVRCSSSPAAMGRNLGDRPIFKTVRDTGKFAIGTTMMSRVTRTSVIPLALPILTNGKFAGMCTIGLSPKAFADAAPAASDDAVLVDRSGTPLGSQAEQAFTLPPAGRVAEAIESRVPVFTDFGQNGVPYSFHVLAVAGDALFAVAAVPLAQGLPDIVADWGLFALILVFLALALLAVWIGAERWVVRPLRHVEEFAGRVARGESIVLQPPRPWTPEMIAVSKGINEMADAIASREGELRSGLQQRDHMLREIHHRVKNNLQMISSLLNLQAGEIRSPRLRRFFGDAQNRVLTLSILHRHLYERSSWSLVDFQQFISDLVRQITVARPSDRPAPRYQIRAPVMAVGPDVAIPVGLIVTEAVSSALSHDFGSVTQPEIRIEATQKTGDRAELVIEDNGRNTGNGSVHPDLRSGFGVTLLRGLSMQLGGEATITAREGGGVRIVVAFPLSPEDGDND